MFFEFFLIIFKLNKLDKVSIVLPDLEITKKRILFRFSFFLNFKMTSFQLCLDLILMLVFYCYISLFKFKYWIHFCIFNSLFFLFFELQKYTWIFFSFIY